MKLDINAKACKLVSFFFFFFQAEDGIRSAQESRGIGDVYKRQDETWVNGVRVHHRETAGR